MTEYLVDIAAIDYPVPDTSITHADLSDWVEQQQLLPIPDDDYPHQSPPRGCTEFAVNWFRL
jgi:hypothetical protein